MRSRLGWQQWRESTAGPRKSGRPTAMIAAPSCASCGRRSTASLATKPGDAWATVLECCLNEGDKAFGVTIGYIDCPLSVAAPRADPE